MPGARCSRRACAAAPERHAILEFEPRCHASSARHYHRREVHLARALALTCRAPLRYYEHVSTALQSLSSVPLFAKLSDRQLRKLLRSANEDRYEADHLIVREGGRSEKLFVVLEGTARVEQKGRSIARKVPGQFFGEVSMIDSRPHTASVVAETPMRCLVLYNDALRKLLVDDPQMAWSLLQMLASRLRDS
jgi:mannose-6-phosphate isomerase-like protein (cupin superfamily)